MFEIKHKNGLCVVLCNGMMKFSRFVFSVAQGSGKGWGAGTGAEGSVWERGGGAERVFGPCLVGEGGKDGRAAFRQEWRERCDGSGWWCGGVLCAGVEGAGRVRAQLSQVANTHPFSLD